MVIAMAPPLETVACNLCGSRSHRAWARVSDVREEPEFTVVTCADCGLGFVNPRYPAAAIRAFFREGAWLGRSVDPEGCPRSLVAERARRALELRPYARALRRRASPGAVLDVGCGLGVFLDLLGPAWERHGVDICPRMIAEASRVSGLYLQAAAFLTADVPDGYYDAVTFLQVLDHLDDPAANLERAHRALKPGGVLLLTHLINLGSFCARVFREGFRLLDPYHPYYFTPAAIRRMLRATGFRVERIAFPYLGTPYCTPREWGRLLARLWQRRRRPHERVVSPPFYGNIMTVWARRPERGEGS